MMDKGEGAEFKGKTLEEIDVNLEILNKNAETSSDVGKIFFVLPIS